MSEADETLGELPEGWQWRRVGEVCEVWGGMTPSTSEARYWDGDVPWVSSKDIKNGRVLDSCERITETALRETRLRVCEPGTLLVVVRSGVLAHSIPTAIADRDLVINQDVKAFRSDIPGFTDWLKLAFQAKERDLLDAHRKDGTTVQSLKVDELRELQIAVPPADERRRILVALGSMLEGVDRQRTRLERLRGVVGRTRRSVLAAAFRGAMTTGPRAPSGSLRVIDNDVQTDIDDERGVSIPAHWRWSTLGQEFEVHVGATPPRKNPAYWGGGIPWVSSGEVAFCRIKATRESISDLGLQNSSTQINPAGSVLLSMIGEGKTRGQPAILSIDAANNQNCAAIWVSRTTFPPEFVYHWLAFQYESTRDGAAGNSQPALNKSRVMAIPIPVPPLEEQKEIVRIVDRWFAVLDDVERRITRGLALCDRLRESLLQRAFRGELLAPITTASPP